MCYAINTLISKKLIHEPRKGTAANVMAMSALMMLPLAWFADFRGATGPVFGNADAVQIGAIVLLGALHTGIATLILFRLISRAGATFFSQINFLVPVFGVAWGAIFLAERPGVNALVSLGLILSGIFIARLAQRRA